MSRANFTPVDRYRAPKKCPQRTKNENFQINLFFFLKSFMKLFKISLLINPSTTNVEKGFSVLTLLSTKQRNALKQTPKFLKQTAATNCN